MEAKVGLGKKLFFEPRLSKSDLISCSTCHNLVWVGQIGFEGQLDTDGQSPHRLNPQTVYNSVLNNIQFWDGRVATLAD